MRSPARGCRTIGTQVLMNVINEIGRNADAQPQGRAVRGREGHLGRGDAEAARPTARPISSPMPACFGCTIACGRISKIDETHFSVVNKPEYWGAAGGLEYEAAWALGAANGVERPRGADLREYALQRGRVRPDLVRLDGRCGHGAVRDGHAEEGADRHGRAFRVGASASETGGDDGEGRRASARSRAWVRRGCAPSTASPNFPWA